jgi:hypothetical protein
MLARNPKTGGQIRVLKSDTSIWKDSKTLVWMKEPFCETEVHWKRWDILVVGTDPAILAWKPDLVVLHENNEQTRSWLKTPDAKATRFILITMKLVPALAKEGFDISALGNVLCLEEYASIYPFLGERWNETVEDAIVCAALVFRYNRLIGVKPDHPRMKILGFEKVNLTLLESCKKPEPLVLIQQYYKPKEIKRAKELYKCLKKNLECEYIDTIILYLESKDVDLPPDPYKKLITLPLKTRITFADCIQTIQKRIARGHLVVFANTDIYLESSWRALWSVNIHDTFLALLRWEEGINGAPHTLFGPRADSQDTWVIHSDSVLDRSWDLKTLQIPFGQAGCDNSICVEFLRKKFKIVNPASSLKTIHVHQSEIRNYDPKNIVDRPTYMFIDPTGFHELNPVLSWDGWAGDPIQYTPLDRPLRATTLKNLHMFCSQINRDTSFVWSIDSKNTYVPPEGQDRPIQMTGGAFVSPNGLVYRHTDICVGTTDIQKAAWSSNTLSHLIPAHGVDEMMAFPLEAEWVQEPSLYILQYLSRILKLRDQVPEGSFWCKKTEGLLAAVKLFKWDISRGRLLEYDDQSQVFSKKVYGRTAHGVRSMPEEIDVLRRNTFSNWVSEIHSTQTVLFVIDTLHIKGDLLENFQEFTESIGLSTKMISSHSNALQWAEALSGVSHVVLSSSLKNLKVSTWAWLWMAPRGCKVLELQEEREPSDSLLHLCAAAGLEWTLLQYPRSTPEGFKKIVFKEYKKWFVTVEEKMSTLPIIYTPPKSMKFGFFGHKGDSFREMIDLWEEKRFIERKEDSSITNCWLGAIGSDGVLLYDRPTWSWLEKSSDKEKSYKLCLAGNPDPSEKTLAKAWIFWPRQPRLVEELSSKLSARSFTSRMDRLVFFGRIENDEQGQWRKDTKAWLNVCTKFSMPVGAKQPYAFNPQEYLEALSNSKYGLCLRGYGPKCNREIELLSMGTVPVVVEGVDMVNYANPLIEGVHYLRVTGPDEAREKIESINEAEWLVMSMAGREWWKQNASIEGSWLKTKDLI